MSDSLQSHGYNLIAFQTPLSMGFSRQEYWSGLPCLPPGDLPEPGIEPRSPSLIGRLFTAEQPGKPSTLGHHFLMCDINSRGVREADLVRVIWTKQCILGKEPAPPVSGSTGICLTIIFTVCVCVCVFSC